MPALTQTHTYVHASTRTHKHVYTDAERYRIVHFGLRDLAQREITE